MNHALRVLRLHLVPGPLAVLWPWLILAISFVVNLAIFAGSAVLFAVALWLVRSQATVDDVAYMKGMIPHHSIAILTSDRAHITDPRVRKLADGIIETQRREIDEMKALIDDIEKNGPRQGVSAGEDSRSPGHISNVTKR